MAQPASPPGAYVEVGPQGPGLVWAAPSLTPLAPCTSLPVGASVLDFVGETPLGACFYGAPGLVALLDPGGVVMNPPPVAGNGTLGQFFLADGVQPGTGFLSVQPPPTFGQPSITPSEPTMNGYPCLVMNATSSSLALKGYGQRKAPTGATGHYLSIPNPSFTFIGACNRASITPAANDYFFSLPANPAFIGLPNGKLQFGTTTGTNLWSPSAGQLTPKGVVGLSYDAATLTSEIWFNGVMMSSFVHSGPIALPRDADICFWQYTTTAMLVGKCGGAGLFNLALAQRSGGNLVYGNAMTNVMLALKKMYGF
jgi:hypothetical protein